MLRVIISIDRGSKVLIAAKGNVKHKSGRRLKYIYVCMYVCMYVYTHMYVQASGKEGEPILASFALISFHSWFLHRSCEANKNSKKNTLPAFGFFTSLFTHDAVF